MEVSKSDSISEHIQRKKRKRPDGDAHEKGWWQNGRGNGPRNKKRPTMVGSNLPIS